MKNDPLQGCGELSAASDPRERRRAQQREAKRKWREANVELDRARKRAHYAKHRASVLAKAQAYRNANREAVRAWHRADYAKHPNRKRFDNLRRKFGITRNEYDALFEFQEGKCAICGESPQRKSLAVDHDHATGEVRGLLCGPCNTALGVAERHEWMARAAAYLSAPRMWRVVGNL